MYVCTYQRSLHLELTKVGTMKAAIFLSRVGILCLAIIRYPGTQAHLSVYLPYKARTPPA
jgi:hypothetical protein